MKEHASDIMKPIFTDKRRDRFMDSASIVILIFLYVIVFMFIGVGLGKTTSILAQQTILRNMIILVLISEIMIMIMLTYKILRKGERI
jgi:hypothetical protein